MKFSSNIFVGVLKLWETVNLQLKSRESKYVPLLRKKKVSITTLSGVIF